MYVACQFFAFCVADNIEKRIEGSKEQLKTIHNQREEAKAELAKPFAYEQELAEKSARLAQLNAELNLDGKGDSDISADEKPSLLGEISNIKKLSKEKDKGNEKNPEKGDYRQRRRQTCYLKRFIAYAITKYSKCDNNDFLSVGLSCGEDFFFLVGDFQKSVAFSEIF